MRATLNCRSHGGRELDEAWAYGKEKIRGAERNLPDFSDCARPLPEIFFSEHINFGDLPPPSPKHFRSVYHFRDQKKCSGTINCKYCPTFKRILHDYLYLNNKLRAFGLFIFPLFARLMLNICPTFRLCKLFVGEAAPPCPPGPYAFATKYSGYFIASLNAVVHFPCEL
jgi:hypothetical protein